MPLGLIKGGIIKLIDNIIQAILFLEFKAQINKEQIKTNILV